MVTYLISSHTHSGWRIVVHLLCTQDVATKNKLVANKLCGISRCPTQFFGKIVGEPKYTQAFPVDFVLAFLKRLYM